MESKFLEIRDRATFIPALAVRISGDDDPLAKAAGFGEPMVLLTKLETMQTQYDPFAWGGRTMPTAHLWIDEHWATTENGAVVDVEFILGERAAPKASEVER